MTTRREIDAFLDFMRVTFLFNETETEPTAVASKESSPTLYTQFADTETMMALDLPPADLTGKYFADVRELPRPLSHNNPRITSRRALPLTSFPGLVRAGM